MRLIVHNPVLLFRTACINTAKKYYCAILVLKFETVVAANVTSVCICMSTWQPAIYSVTTATNKQRDILTDRGQTNKETFCILFAELCALQREATVTNIPLHLHLLMQCSMQFFNALICMYCRSWESCETSSSWTRRYHHRAGENTEYVDYSAQDK